MLNFFSKYFSIFLIIYKAIHKSKSKIRKYLKLEITALYLLHCIEVLSLPQVHSHRNIQWNDLSNKCHDILNDFLIFWGLQCKLAY